MIWPAVCSGYPLVSSKLAKMLGFKGYLPLPLSPTPRSKFLDMVRLNLF